MARRPVLFIALATSVLGGMGGCSDSLFNERAPRTPYQRYMVLHGEDRPEHQTNRFGGEEPALRQRLTPLESP